MTNSLVGTWRLVSASQRLTDGTVRPDPQTGSRGTGYIMYSDTGRMCAVLANPDRPKWKSETAPVEAEVRAAFDGLVAYCGTYEVNDAEGYVVHHIEMDRVPNLSGTDRKRDDTLSGNRLYCARRRHCPWVCRSGPWSGSAFRATDES